MTPYQYGLFSILCREIREARGLVPSRKELTVAWGLASKNSVQRHLNAMATAGVIRLVPQKARAIEIVPFCAVAADKYGDAVIVGMPV